MDFRVSSVGQQIVIGLSSWACKGERAGDLISE